MSKWNSILPKCCLKLKSSVLTSPATPDPRPHPGSCEVGGATALTGRVDRLQ